MNLMELLPPYYNGNLTMEKLQSIIETEICKVTEGLDKTISECFINTSSDLLSRYEKILGLPIRYGTNDELRRSIIKAKLLMQPPASKSKIIDIIKSFVEAAEVKEYFSEYKFEVVLKTLDTIGDKLPYIKQIVDDFKPAHLDYAFIVCYLFYPKISYLFGKWLSEEINTCGKEDINKNKYIATIGLSYKDKILYMLDKWLSSDFARVSERTTIQGDEGLNYRNKILYLFGKWLSNFIMASEQTTIQCEGRIFKYKTMYDIGAFESVRIPACSENIYVKEVVA
ncbi:MAG: hypothetical protein ACFWT2_15565 [Thermoanaerobacterium thermosaccharolyticum]|jgi:hypothetical protein